MSEHILIIGGGIAGLNAALALQDDTRTLTILDRDPPPPETSADEAFDNWERKGVGHLRHSHAFLARLYILLRDKYPDLLQDLLDAGCRSLTFQDTVPIMLKDRYEPRPSDADLSILTSRRTTLEFIMRRYVSALPRVSLVSDTRVTGYRFARTDDGTLKTTGVQILQDGNEQELDADIVINACGKNDLGFDWLADEGITPRMDREEAGILYYTRHYRLKPGQKEPERGLMPGAADLGYLKYGVFPADNGCFSITLAVPEIETELRRAIIRPENFDQISRSIAGLESWIDPDRTDPTSRVFGMGELKSHWRYMVEDGKPLVQNYFAMGDTLIRTNPLYGRGCSFAAVEAQALSNALNASTDPIARACAYDAEVTREIRPYYENMVKEDLAAMRRAKNGLNPHYKAGIRARFLKSFVEDAINIALRSDIHLFRQAMQGFHMLQHPTDWLKQPGNFAKVLWVWMKGKRLNRRYYLPKLGPNRTEMLTALELSPTLDWEKLQKPA